MQELRQQFIDSAIKNLEILSRKISSAEDFPDTFVQDIFRQIHTIKGTAQTFDFKKSSRIAHELESILSDAKNGRHTLSKQLLIEYITALEKSFDEHTANNNDNSIEKTENAALVKIHSVTILPELPENILSSLSISEIESLSADFENRKTISCVEVYFKPAGFRENLLNFRKILEDNGKIIATFPAKRKDLQIGFRFLLAEEKSFEQILKFADNFAPKIVFSVSPLQDDLLKILKELTNHGRKITKQLGKKLKFEILIGDISFSENQLNIIFNVLLHLIRNAVSHAIEIPSERVEKEKPESGKIEIRFSPENDYFKITVSDDGKGIDTVKIKSKAIKDKFISESDELDEQEILNLVFLPEFSTAENLTEVSGRGVGLYSVRNEIENAGGNIKVINRKNFGTEFEIFIPAKI